MLADLDSPQRIFDFKPADFESSLAIKDSMSAIFDSLPGIKDTVLVDFDSTREILDSVSAIFDSLPANLDSTRGIVDSLHSSAVTLSLDRDYPRVRNMPRFDTLKTSRVIVISTVREIKRASKTNIRPCSENSKYSVLKGVMDCDGNLGQAGR
jgi:hypothetical protein